MKRSAEQMKQTIMVWLMKRYGFVPADKTPDGNWVLAHGSYFLDIMFEQDRCTFVLRNGPGINSGRAFGILCGRTNGV